MGSDLSDLKDVSCGDLHGQASRTQTACFKYGLYIFWAMAIWSKKPLNPCLLLSRLFSFTFQPTLRFYKASVLAHSLTDNNYPTQVSKTDPAPPIMTQSLVELLNCIWILCLMHHSCIWIFKNYFIDNRNIPLEFKNIV